MLSARATRTTNYKSILQGIRLAFLVLSSAISTNWIARAQEPAFDKLPDSWSWVPAKVDLFWGYHNVDRQLSELWENPFVARVQQTAFWRKADALYWKEWKDRKSDLARVKATIDNPIAREIRKFLYDVVSNDFFLVVDDHFSKSVQQWNRIQPSLERLLDDSTSSATKAEIVSDWIEDVLPEFQLPTIVLAGRISQPELANARIDEIEGLLRLGIGFVPDIGVLFKKLERVEDKRGNRLVWTVNSDVIPWDSIPETDVLDRESIQDLKANAKNKALVLSIGTLDDYFCITISGDPAWTQTFGATQANSTDRFRDHPELQTLLRELPKTNRLTNRSSNLVESTGSSGSPFETRTLSSTYFTSDSCIAAYQGLVLDGFFRKLARNIIIPQLEQWPKLSDTYDFLVTTIDEAGRVDDVIGKHVPRYRGRTSLGWTRSDGFETIELDRNPMHLMDGSKRLDGIQLVGENPLLVLNLRLASHPEFFVTAREVVRKLKRSLDDMVSLEGNGWDLGPWRMIATQARSVWPALTLATDAWQNQVLPNLEGEHLVVVQRGGLTSKRWIPNLPESTSPLPLPEVALVSSTKDIGVWAQGAAIIAKGIEGWLRNAGINLGAINQQEQIGGWNLSKLPATQLATEEGRFEVMSARHPKWVWFGYSSAQWEAFSNQLSVRTSKPATLPSDPTPSQKLLGFQEANGPLASAAVVDFGGIASLLKPWGEALLEQFPVDGSGNLQLPPTATGRKLEVNRQEVIEFLDALSQAGILSSFSNDLEGQGSLSRSQYRGNR